MTGVDLRELGALERRLTIRVEVDLIAQPHVDRDRWLRLLDAELAEWLAARLHKSPGVLPLRAVVFELTVDERPTS